MENDFIFGRETKQDTMSEVSEMMQTPTMSIDPIAMEYVKHLSSIYGFCGEMMVTAFAHYCQAVKELPCDNPDYKMTDQDKEWFIQKGYIQR